MEWESGEQALAGACLTLTPTLQWPTNRMSASFVRRLRGLSPVMLKWARSVGSQQGSILQPHSRIHRAAMNVVGYCRRLGKPACRGRRPCERHGATFSYRGRPRPRACTHEHSQTHHCPRCNERQLLHPASRPPRSSMRTFHTHAHRLHLMQSIRAIAHCVRRLSTLERERHRVESQRDTPRASVADHQRSWEHRPAPGRVQLA